MKRLWKNVVTVIVFALFIANSCSKNRVIFADTYLNMEEAELFDQTIEFQFEESEYVFIENVKTNIGFKISRSLCDSISESNPLRITVSDSNVLSFPHEYNPSNSISQENPNEQTVTFIYPGYNPKEEGDIITYIYTVDAISLGTCTITIDVNGKSITANVTVKSNSDVAPFSFKESQYVVTEGIEDTLWVQVPDTTCSRVDERDPMTITICDTNIVQFTEDCNEFLDPVQNDQDSQTMKLTVPLNEEHADGVMYIPIRINPISTGTCLITASHNSKYIDTMITVCEQNEVIDFHFEKNQYNLTSGFESMVGIIMPIEDVYKIGPATPMKITISDSNVLQFKNYEKLSDDSDNTQNEQTIIFKDVSYGTYNGIVGKWIQVKAISKGTCTITASLRGNVISTNVSVDDPERIAVNYQTNYHTKDDIKSYIKSNKIDLSKNVEYTVVPETSSPYEMGSLSEDTLQNALDVLNTVRYIAGIDSVILDDTYNTYAQAASLVNCANGLMTHHPTKPLDMDESLFELGYEGASHSNLFCSTCDRSLGYSIVHGWMADDDISNISKVGHRRWALNPNMGKVGFGYVTDSSKPMQCAMYSTDGSNVTSQYTGVSWPAQTMPLEYFSDDYPWSISFSEPVDKENLVISLTRESDNKLWIFSESNCDGYFNVNNEAYGQPGCIIFKPNEISYKDGDVFSVSVKSNTIDYSYKVEFFTLNENSNSPMSPVDNQNQPEDDSTTPVDNQNQPEDNSTTPVDNQNQSDDNPTTPINTPNPIIDNSTNSVIPSVVNEPGSDTNPDNTVTNNQNESANTIKETVITELLEFDKEVGTIEVGKKASLSVLFTPENVTDKTVTWSSSNPEIADVDNKGVITGKKEGTAVIMAITNDGSEVSASITINVKNVKVKKIKTSFSKVTLEVGKSKKINAVITPKNATNKILTYTSSNKKVAKVSKTGKITAKRKGTAIITIQSSDGIQAKVIVNVYSGK